MEESATILADNITVASGWKCKECNLIRPYDRPTCPCQE